MELTKHYDTLPGEVSVNYIIFNEDTHVIPPFHIIPISSYDSLNSLANLNEYYFLIKKTPLLYSIIVYVIIKIKKITKNNIEISEICCKNYDNCEPKNNDRKIPKNRIDSIWCCSSLQPLKHFMEEEITKYNNELTYVYNNEALTCSYIFEKERLFYGGKRTRKSRIKKQKKQKSQRKRYI